MVSARLFLKDYDRLGENEKVTEKSVKLPAVPADGQALVVDVSGRLKPYFVSGVYMQADRQEVTVFATATSFPHQDAIRLGLREGDLGVPSLTNFEGKKVSELMAFLNQFPADDEVIFENRAILVAQSKTDYVILRLDDPAEYEN